MDRLTIPRRAGIEAPAELAAIRDMIGDPALRYPRHASVNLSYRTVGNVRCLILTPRVVAVRLLYFHGGGFRLGSPEIAAGFASRLADSTSCEVVIPFYSLAPEHPFPNALLEGQQVLETMINEKPLFIGGDSAGGNLAAVLARRFSDRLSGVLLLSPWLDLRIEATSYGANAEQDAVFSMRSATDAAALYLQGVDPVNPDVSPLLADLTTIPPVFITVGAEEVLVDDATTFADQLSAVQRQCSLEIIPGMCHVEPTLKPDSEHTRMVLNSATSFMQQLLKPAGNSGRRIKRNLA